MISDETRRRLWGEKEEAGRLQLYYEALGTRRSRQQIAIRTAVLFSISGGFSPLLDAVPPWVGLVLTSVAMLLTLVELQLGWGAQAAVSRAMGTACSLLLEEWKNMWGDAEAKRVTEEGLVERMEKQRRLDILVTGMASAHGLNHSEAVSRRVSSKVHVYRPIKGDTA